MKRLLISLLPPSLLGAYHYTAAAVSALVAGSPSRKMVVIGITGTKGKSTTAELVRTILEGAGHTVALASTIRFSVGGESEPNLFKMTMPGRGYLQRFLAKALRAGATHAVIEMTSEGARQFRHVGLELDALVFTNLSPEHIESHGSLEHYIDAKLSLSRHLEHSRKRPRIIVANADDAVGARFLEAGVEVKAPFSLEDAKPYSADDNGVRFVWRGELFSVPLPGLFSLKNCLAALALGHSLGVETSVMKKALEHVGPIPGRAERVERGQRFSVIVDYAHTPDSLKALYEAYAGKRKICVLGSMGGGRDSWKSPEMGRIADEHCDVAILTEEDPYDDDPKRLVDNVAAGFRRRVPRIIPERRAAIRDALKEAHEGDAVLITGKGTDPFIMGPRGTKRPWSDKKVAEEELEKLGYHKN
jgi:UDP-N-acetylmuramoyl-L-alanyl-D-glutamate--2,6-diaminopimelate ligase